MINCAILINTNPNASDGGTFEKLHLSEEKRFASTFAANNIQQIQSRQGIFSETVEAPITHHNSRLLGYAENINSSFDRPYRKIPVIVTEDEQPILYCTMQIVSVSDKYVLLLTGGNTEFYQAIEGKYINEVNLAKFNHAWTLENILASEINTWEKGYFYPIIDYGKLKNRENVVAYDELYPAVFVRYILQQMAHRAGFVLKGKFLNSKLLNGQFIPTNKVPQYDEAFVKARTCKASNLEGRTLEAGSGLAGAGRYLDFIPFNDVSSGKDVQASVNYNPQTYEYTTDKPLFVNFSIQIPFKVQCTEGKCKIKFTLENNGQEVDVFEKKFRSGLLGSNTLFQAAFTFKTQLVKPGDSYKVRLEMRDDSTLFIYNIWAYLDTATSAVQNNRQRAYLEAAAQQTLPPGADIRLIDFLPKLSQSDLMRLLVNQFNLLLSTDNEKKILYIEKFNAVVDNLPNAANWTAKVDYSEAPELQFLDENYGQKSIFRYKNDPNDPLIAIPDENKDKDYGFGSSYIEIDNKHLEAEKVVFEAQFAATMKHSALNGSAFIPSLPIFQIKDDVRYGIWHPDMIYHKEPVQDYVQMRGDYFKAKINDIDESKPPYYFESGEWRIATGEWEKISLDQVKSLFTENTLVPRILYKDQTIITPVNLLAAGTVSDYSPYAAHCSFLPLSFENNLLAANYPALANALRNGKYLRCLIRLNAIDIKNLDYTKPVYIESAHMKYSHFFNAYFFISAITQYQHGSTESTYVELLKLTGSPFPEMPKVGDQVLKILGLLQENGAPILSERGYFILLEKQKPLEFNPVAIE